MRGKGLLNPSCLNFEIGEALDLKHLTFNFQFNFKKTIKKLTFNRSDIVEP